MELEIVELSKHQDEIVVNSLQLPPIRAGLRLRGFHKTPQCFAPIYPRRAFYKMTKWQWINS